MKNFKWMGLVLAVLCLSACNKEKEVAESTVLTTTQVGDFNFVAQNTRAPEHTFANTGTFTYETDIYGAPIIETDIAQTTAVDSDNSIYEDTTTAPIILSPDAVSSFVDLSSNIALQIGENIYMSVPKSAVESCIDLDTFLDNTRVAYNLVADEDKDTLEVQKQRYSGGSCLHLEGSKMYLQALGLGCWVKNFGTELNTCKAPTMSFFNLGKISGNLGYLDKSYKKLGAKISETETEYFYKAIFDIADLAGNENIDARAVVIFNKATGSASTCVININKKYYSEGLVDVDYLASSVRYSVVAPDNLANIQ